MHCGTEAWVVIGIDEGAPRVRKGKVVSVDGRFVTVRVRGQGGDDMLCTRNRGRVYLSKDEANAEAFVATLLGG
jgi:hypothetical protein